MEMKSGNENQVINHCKYYTNFQKLFRLFAHQFLVATQLLLAPWRPLKM